MNDSSKSSNDVARVPTSPIQRIALEIVSATRAGDSYRVRELESVLAHTPALSIADATCKARMASRMFSAPPGFTSIDAIEFEDLPGSARALIIAALRDVANLPQE